MDCRHSAAILEKLIMEWPKRVLDKLHLNFLDASYPAQGKSDDVEGIFDPPFYEWFQFNMSFRKCFNFEECLEYLEDYMLKHGSFDGLLGFSQGGLLAAAIPGMQRDGAALTKILKIKFVIIVSAAKFGGRKLGTPTLAENAFSMPLDFPSFHIIGEKDYMFIKEEGEALSSCFVDPMVIYYSKGHTVPRLDKEGEETMLNFIDKIQDDSGSTKSSSRAMVLSKIKFYTTL